jgi:predicted CXXCH cytochrome family protein
MITIAASQLPAPAVIPQPSGILFNHTGADTNSKADSCRVCHTADLDIKSASNDFCYGCHPAEQRKVSKRYQHPRITDGKYLNLDCEGCHKLHKASAEKQLSQKETMLCYSCHPETKEYKSHPVLEFDKGFGPEPIKGPDGRVIDCASHCHDTHGADYKYLCTGEPGRELCISCHKDFQ